MSLDVSVRSRVGSFDIEADFAAGPGVTGARSSRGLATGDLDNDGTLEIVTLNMYERPSLLKNFGERGNSLLVRALTLSGRDAVGARLTLILGERRIVEEVRSGGNFMGSTFKR